MINVRDVVAMVPVFLAPPGPVRLEIQAVLHQMQADLIAGRGRVAAFHAVDVHTAEG